MDNLITSCIGAIIFIAFVAGLAESIGELPFIIIVGLVCVMVLIDVYQSIREGFADPESDDRNRKA